MNLLRAAAPLICLLLLHTPEGDQLWIRSERIASVQPVVGTYHHHVAKNTHSIIYDGRARGLRETAETIIGMIKSCEVK